MSWWKWMLHHVEIYLYIYIHLIYQSIIHSSRCSINQSSFLFTFPLYLKERQMCQVWWDDEVPTTWFGILAIILTRARKSGEWENDGSIPPIFIGIGETTIIMTSHHANTTAMLKSNVIPNPWRNEINAYFFAADTVRTGRERAQSRMGCSQGNLL